MEQSKRKGTEGAEEGPLSTEQAAKLIIDSKHKDDPRVDPNYRPPLEETTTPEIRSRLGAQVFRDKDFGETYLIKANTVYHLGRAVGGGVNSMLVEDIDGDGQPELWYTFSWGSGMHYSQLGSFGISASKVDELERAVFFTLSDDASLRRNEQGKPEIWVHQFLNRDGDTMHCLGRMTYDKDREKVTLLLDEHLPDEIRNLSNPATKTNHIK